VGWGRLAACAAVGYRRFLAPTREYALGPADCQSAAAYQAAPQWRRRISGTLWSLRVTSTTLRKNLFQIFERALQGELVEVAHKGRLIRLVPENKPGKLSRLIQRDTINGTLEDLDRALL
jgi:antitoxin (DNA-binding transcriptional repressor) of toxin-antitoxin stability system